MYANLNAESLGVNGRQNELIELTLTYKFRGFDIQIDDLVSQVEERGKDHATRFLQSANVDIGSFELPVDLAATDEEFEAALTKLDGAAELAASLGTTRCISQLSPYSVERAYHEDFELHRERIGRVAQILKPHGIRLGLGIAAPKHLREDGGAQFVATPDALLTLIQTVVEDNVGLCLDTWHWHVGGGTLDQLNGFAMEKIVMVRLADVPSDVDVDSITEEQRVLPGSTGVVPNVEWIRWLRDQNYAGPVTPFCHPTQFTGGRRNQSVEQAATALKALLATAGGDEETADQAETATAG